MNFNQLDDREKLAACAKEFGLALASFYDALHSFEGRDGFAQVELPIAASALNSAVFWMTRAERLKAKLAKAVSPFRRAA